MIPGHARLVARSLEIVKEYQAPSGAYLAAPRPHEYRNAWLRDGAFVADAMSRAGETGSADAFFRWCGTTIGRRADRIARLLERLEAGESVPPDEHLPCRYTPDGDDVAGPWSGFQLDGYGGWLWALAGHARRHRFDARELAESVEATLRYLAAFWRVPMYDWWEERLGIHTASLAAMAAGLTAGAELPSVSDAARSEAALAATAIGETLVADARSRGRFGAELGADRLDGSLVACATPFRVVEPDDPLAVATIAALEAELAHGGVHRYAGDDFYGGGEWLPLAGLLGWYYAEAGRQDDARAELEWMAAHATRAGELPEQIHHHLLRPAYWQRWNERWGPPANPLLWSQAAFVTLALCVDVTSQKLQ